MSPFDKEPPRLWILKCTRCGQRLWAGSKPDEVSAELNVREHICFPERVLMAAGERLKTWRRVFEQVNGRKPNFDEQLDEYKKYLNDPAGVYYPEERPASPFQARERTGGPAQEQGGYLLRDDSHPDGDQGNVPGNQVEAIELRYRSSAYWEPGAQPDGRQGGR